MPDSDRNLEDRPLTIPHRGAGDNARDVVEAREDRYREAQELRDSLKNLMQTAYDDPDLYTA